MIVIKEVLEDLNFNDYKYIRNNYPNEQEYKWSNDDQDDDEDKDQKEQGRGKGQIPDEIVLNILEVFAFGNYRDYCSLINDLDSENDDTEYYKLSENMKSKLRLFGIIDEFNRGETGDDISFSKLLEIFNYTDDTDYDMKEDQDEEQEQEGSAGTDQSDLQIKLIEELIYFNNSQLIEFKINCHKKLIKIIDIQSRDILTKFDKELKIFNNNNKDTGKIKDLDCVINELTNFQNNKVLKLLNKLITKTAAEAEEGDEEEINKDDEVNSVVDDTSTDQEMVINDGFDNSKKRRIESDI
ncbi:unnamed protein product [[Candida] boidinii]|uniref:Unnamed protein product n=1 Tax=Candida boidinii TaxID=5477 RepID=A0A9W6ST09_CANBO|nr:hypothetical protein B5S30_g4203 [[Candida] boidinii]OWB86861.1 hypothetical protein B5S33_g5580 [[Candida] boidinii]GME66711.1 unnamed protein product [[Candida] boidinii]GME92290.1 unnamed protein product [[Candida] boidinii]GMF98827.1 unnamed protein product [[Candida] boidinii]